MIRYRAVSGKSRTLRRPNPLVLEMGSVLEKVLDSRRDDEEVLRVISRIDFFLDYAFLVLRYRQSLLDPELETDERLEEEISEKERSGVGLGFPLERLVATARALTDRTPTLEEVAKWKAKVLRVKKSLSRD